MGYGLGQHTSDDRDAGAAFHYALSDGNSDFVVEFLTKCFGLGLDLAVVGERDYVL